MHQTQHMRVEVASANIHKCINTKYGLYNSDLAQNVVRGNAHTQQPQAACHVGHDMANCMDHVDSIVASAAVKATSIEHAISCNGTYQYSLVTLSK